MKSLDIAVVGGGASGLAFAVTVKKLNRSASVIVVEKGERAARKLAASGNGQGNVSNALMTKDHFHGSGAPLAEKLCCSGEYDPLSLFDFLFVTDKSGRIYPAGKQASALSDCLIREAKETGVEIVYNTSVVKIDKGFTLTLSDGSKIGAKTVVLAVGGMAQKQFGTDGRSYALAKALGHSLTPTYPSLIQLKCDTKHIKNLRGIRSECVLTATDSGGNALVTTRGDVIFTDYGVSGNAVFYVSAYCADREGVTLSIQFIPDISLHQLQNNVEKRMAAGCPREELLSGTLHNQIGRAIMRRCTSDNPSEIAALVKNFTLKVEGPLGFDYAQVTKGGVPADELTDELESKKVKNLFVIGEAVDVDGDCGGYNLTWAFASAMHAAKAVAGRIKND